MLDQNTIVNIHEGRGAGGLELPMEVTKKLNVQFEPGEFDWGDFDEPVNYNSKCGAPNNKNPNSDSERTTLN